MVQGVEYGAMYVIEFVNPVSSIIISPPTIEQLSKWKSFEYSSFSINDFLEYKPNEITEYKLIEFIDMDYVDTKSKQLENFYYGCVYYSNYYEDEKRFINDLKDDLSHGHKHKYKTIEEKQQFLEDEIMNFRDYLSTNTNIDKVNELLNESLALELKGEFKNRLKIIMDLEKDNIKWHGWKFKCYDY